MNVVVATSNKYLWCLSAFSSLFNKYYSENQDVYVIGYAKPDFTLPSNFHFYQICEVDYGKEKWVDGVLDFFDKNNIGDQFVFMLEDYWLCRKFDLEFIDTARNLMNENKKILRIDLSADRLYAGGCRDAFYSGKYDFVEAPLSQYQMSLQPGIWSTKLFTEILKILPSRCHSAWSVELEGTNVVNDNPHEYIVYGTRQLPMRFVNGMSNAKQDMVNVKGLIKEDINMIQDSFPPKLEMNVRLS